MRFIKNSVEFKLYELDSESELREYIRANKGITVGNDAQVKRKFYVIENLNDNVKKVVGILNEGHGIIPTIVKFKNTDAVVFTSDKSIYFFDTKKNEVTKTLLCYSLIFDVVTRENEGKMFIICELGIQCLTITGDKIWAYDSEIVSDFAFYDDYVKLTVEDIDYKISLLNGEILQKISI
ncbi:hypothetical protein [Dehalobacter sp. TBBPA1]|uniref:hypothetical protein n=1 Tax=Dehalobacter sp. TBBPA1 TaxID=3235037 RepID=UPI0034A20699